jgi:hypothetical protein
LKRLGEFFLRIFRVVGRSADWAEPGAEAVGSISHRISGHPKPSPRPKMRAGMDRNPGQGSQRTLPVSSFVLDWERHFDAAQALREVVTP